MTSESTIDTAFVLVAGLGTRMRPITDTLPKPLVEVAGRTLLDHALDTLQQSGVTRAVVNVHHLADQIEHHVASRSAPSIVVSDERAQLLDSGGGIAAALPLFEADAFFVLNADTFWREDETDNLDAMRAAWDADMMDILLLLASHDQAVGFDGRGDFFMDDRGVLARRGDAAAAPHIYAGALIIKRSCFDGETDKAFSLNRLFDRALENGRLHGCAMDGLWLHVGTPGAIGEAETALAARAGAS